MNCDIKWDPQQLRKVLTKGQAFVDSECVRYMRQYTPMRTGALMRSATLGTRIGSGHIVYNSPYARYQYYGIVYGPNIPIYVNGELEGFFSRRGVKKRSTGRRMQYSKARRPQAQRLWFEVMKKKHGAVILRGLAELIGGKTE